MFANGTGGRAVYRSSWCEIDLSRFRENLRRLRSLAGTRTLLVVKANAYGHGLSRMAAEAAGAGIDMLGVATIGEAETLRANGVSTPTLVMCAIDATEIEYCVANGVHFLAWRPDQFADAFAAADRYGCDPLIHLEVDTGMSRSGVDAGDFAALVESLSERMRGCVVGLASHFHSADLESTESAAAQLQEFQDCVKVAEQLGLRPMLHIANSPGTIRLPASRLGLARLGVAAYGLLPSAHTPLPSGVGPVLSWHARITNVKDIPPGRGVGYGWRYVADRTERVATLGIGYADGFRRSPEGVNTVLAGGVETPVVGSVFMDQCVFLVPPGVDCQVGDQVVLVGRQGGRSITAEDIAVRWGTNNYDVVAGIRNRVPRRYADPAA